MKLFHHRKQVLPLPPGCTPADIATSSSVCTGETLIGFRLPSGELAGAVLCRNEEDRRAFYRRYGLSPDDK